MCEWEGKNKGEMLPILEKISRGADEKSTNKGQVVGFGIV